MTLQNFADKWALNMLHMWFDVLTTYKVVGRVMQLQVGESHFNIYNTIIIQPITYLYNKLLHISPGISVEHI